jgi:hypothetical protein
MTVEQRLDIMKDIFENECIPTFTAKGKSYARDADALANFKINAERLELSKYQVWSIYFMKHVDSIINAIKDNPTNPEDFSEGLFGRITDVINYAGLLKCLKVEDIAANNLAPKAGAVAYCSAECLGLITSTEPQDVTYTDGTVGKAWTGIQLTEGDFIINGQQVHITPGMPWSSRTPKVVRYGI